MLVHAVDYVADATVDYAPAVLWITGLSALWITMLRICGLGRGGDVGLASPPRPQGRTESCTLRILRMLLLVLTEKRAVLAVDFPALRARAHISAPDGDVE